jgi:predicted O-methyltransferase YrrM
MNTIHHEGSQRFTKELSLNDVLARAGVIYSITTEAERGCLAQLAREVPDQGLMVEIGCLYGGVTAVLALSNPSAAVIAIDDFSWHPEGMPVNSAAMVLDNMRSVGVDNVTIIEGDSRGQHKAWARKIDLLWIDGGHSFEYVRSDLFNFAKWCEVIALHDYENPEEWMGITRAVGLFLERHRNWYLDQVVGMVAVLRRVP